jgi:hypothetical protein
VNWNDVTRTPEMLTGPFPWDDPADSNTCIIAYSGTFGVSAVYFAASLVSSTARPLYSPHLAQARWGSFFSWQFGHSETPVAVRKSWERRRAVRRVEWRLFGFGMMQFLSCSRPVKTAGVPDCLAARAEHQNIYFEDFIWLRSPESASQRGSDGPSSQEQSWLLRF